MTHAAKSSDAIDRLMAYRDMLDLRIAEEQARSAMIETEMSGVDHALLLADVLSILREINQRNLSEHQRTRLKAIKDRVHTALRSA